MVLSRSVLPRKSEKFLKSEKASAGRRSISVALIGPMRGGALAPAGTSGEPIAKGLKRTDVGSLAGGQQDLGGGISEVQIVRILRHQRLEA